LSALVAATGEREEFFERLIGESPNEKTVAAAVSAALKGS